MPVGRIYSRWLVALLALLGTSSFVAAQTSSVPSLIVSGLGRGTVPLDGAWQFHTGDNHDWALPEYDDSQWEQIDIARPWGDQGHWAYSGFAWYRRHLSFGPPSAGYEPNPDDVAMFMPHSQSIYEVYWNGLLVSPPQPMPASSADQFTPNRVFRLGPAHDGVLAIRIWTVPLDSQATGDDRGLAVTPRLGNPEAVTQFKLAADAAHRNSGFTALAQMLLYGELGLLGLIVWQRNREQKLLQWMVLFFFASMLAVVANSPFRPLIFGRSILFFSPVHALEDISLWYLLLYLLDLNGNSALMRWTRALAWISILSATADNILFMLDWSSLHAHAFQILDAIFTFGFSAAAIFPLVLIAIGLRKRLDSARWLVAIAAFLSEMYDVVQHTAVQGRLYTHLTLGQTMMAPLFTVGGFAIAMPAVLSTLLVGAIVYAVYRFTVEQGQRQTAMLQEFKSAQELQRVLIPETLPALPGYAITSAYRPAAEVGGDFFQLIPLASGQPDGAALLVVGDVSGKGLKAAMAVSMIVGALRALAEITDDPGAILAGMNRRIVGRLTDGFVTCLVLRINTKGECALANAGHLAPFLNREEIALEGTLPLGLVPEARYETMQLKIDVGDRLTLFTDGLLEARNASGEVYGFERMAALLATRPDASKAVEAAVAFGQEDDITVLTLTRLAMGVESTTLLIAPRLASAKPGANKSGLFQPERESYVEQQSSISSETLPLQ
jgi:hypothetical protein